MEGGIRLSENFDFQKSIFVRSLLEQNDFHGYITIRNI